MTVAVVVGWLFIACGTFVATFVTWVCVRHIYPKTRWTRREAVITGLHDDGDGCWAIEYRYAIDGGSATGRSSASTTAWRSLPIGAQVTIVVDPADESRSDVPLSIYSCLHWLVLLFGLLFVAMGALGLRYPAGWP